MKRATVGMIGSIAKVLGAIAPLGGMLSAIAIPLMIAALCPPLQAQVSPITKEPGTNTNINPDAGNPNQFNITGGQLSGDNQNLFHSFQQFGLDSGQIANFLANPNIQNILGRVMGGTPSEINGLIQVTVQGGSGTPNLYLMNPAGIIFGQNASLNVPASFTATTATSIGFGNNWFNASGVNDYAALVGSPNAFAFNVNQPGAIINAANLSVNGGDLTLLGGTVVSTGQLTTAGGRVTIAGVPGTNFVRLTVPNSLLSLEVQPIATANTQPGNWTFPVQSLPQLLTGGSAGNATGLEVNSQGQVVLTGSGIQVNSNTGTVFASDTIRTQGGSLEISGANIEVDQIFSNGGNIKIDGNIVTANGKLSTGYDDGSVPVSGNITIDGNNVTVDSLSAGENLTLTSQEELTIQDSNLSAGANLTLDSQGGNLNLENSQLLSGGKIELLAQDTVQVTATSPTDSFTPPNPFVAQAGGDLKIQGNNAIDIQAAEKWFQSGGDLTLISNGEITGNSRFASGGNFATRKLLGQPATFNFTSISSDGIISSQGDVSFGGYTGVALKVEAMGSITVNGDITIEGPNTSFLEGIDPNSPIVATDPDIPFLTRSSALILRAGLTELQNSPNVPPTFSSTGKPSSTQGSITVNGNIDTSVGGDGGPVIMSATGNITTGNINAQKKIMAPYENNFTQQGGFVNISTNGNIVVKDVVTTRGNVDIVGASITTGKIDTSVVGGWYGTGDVTLNSTSGDIVVHSIKADDDIDLTSAGLFRAIGTFNDNFLSDESSTKPEAIIAVKDSPELINFFVSQGFKREEVENSQLKVSIIPFAQDSPISLAALSNQNSRIIIRHGGASNSDNGNNIQIYGGGTSLNFVLGPKDTPVVGQEFIYFDYGDEYLTPLNPNQAFPKTGSIAFQRNIGNSSSLDQVPGAFPPNVSGTAGGIVVGGGSDATLNYSLRNRPFVPTSTAFEPPVEPPVKPPVEPPVKPPVEPPVKPPVEPPVEPPVNNTSSSVVADNSGSDSGNTQIATQIFEQQDENDVRITRFCRNAEETSQKPTNESDRTDEEDCEKIDFFQRLNSQLTILRIELHLPADAPTQPNSNVPRSSLPN